MSNLEWGWKAIGANGGIPLSTILDERYRRRLCRKLHTGGERGCKNENRRKGERILHGSSAVWFVSKRCSNNERGR